VEASVKVRTIALCLVGPVLADMLCTHTWHSLTLLLLAIPGLPIVHGVVPVTLTTVAGRAGAEVGVIADVVDAESAHNQTWRSVNYLSCTGATQGDGDSLTFSTGPTAAYNRKVWYGECREANGSETVHGGA
jgi:hypothetical protein